MFTGKNKEQFEKWYIQEYRKKAAIQPDHIGFFIHDDLYNKRFAEQQGVYLEYLDSVGLYISPSQIGNQETGELWRVHIHTNPDYRLYFPWANERSVKSRQEALTEAFKKADELINNK